MAIKIAVVDDFRSIFAGTQKLGEAFDDVADSIDSLDDQAKTAARGVEQQMDKLEDAATDAASTYDRKFSDAFEAVRKDAKKTGDTVRDETSDGTRRAGAATGEFKNEARQNFSEVASSFSGDMTGAVDVVQGTLGGLANSMSGPVGLALGGLALAAGAFASAWQEQTAATKQRVDDMFADMVESGRTAVSENFITTELAKIYSGADDAAISWKKLQDVVETTGASEETVALAFAGNAEAGRELTERLADARQSVADRAAAIIESGGRVSAALGTEATHLADLTSLWEGTGDATQTASDRAAGYQAAVQTMSGVTQAEQRAIQAGYDNIHGTPVTVKAVLDTTDYDREFERLQRTPGTVEFKARIGQAGVM